MTETWQPIETFVKDEIVYSQCTSSVLVWDNAIYIAAWFDSWRYDQRYPEAARDGAWVIGGGHVIKPTHWMPLPKGPA
jgi:hypothetical protein